MRVGDGKAARVCDGTGDNPASWHPSGSTIAVRQKEKGIVLVRPVVTKPNAPGPEKLADPGASFLDPLLESPPEAEPVELDT